MEAAMKGAASVLQSLRVVEKRAPSVIAKEVFEHIDAFLRFWLAIVGAYKSEQFSKKA